MKETNQHSLEAQRQYHHLLLSMFIDPIILIRLLGSEGLYSLGMWGPKRSEDS